MLQDPTMKMLVLPTLLDLMLMEPAPVDISCNTPMMVTADAATQATDKVQAHPLIFICSVECQLQSTQHTQQSMKEVTADKTHRDKIS